MGSVCLSLHNEYGFWCCNHHENALKPLVPGYFFCTSCMLVGSHRRGVNEMDLPIHIALHIQSSLQLSKHLVPDAGLAPTLETAVDRGPLAVPFGHISPGCTRSQHPHNSVQELSMILCWSSTFRFYFRKQRFHPFPLFIREVASVSHATKFNYPFAFCIQTLAIG